jgi:hypothetical protein
LVPFVAVVLPALVVLGLFTVVRLVDSALENMRYLAGIARIRAYYRTLGPEAAAQFAADRGRWPEAPSEPSQRFGPLLATATTSASTIGFVDGVVAGAAVALLTGDLWGGLPTASAVGLGVFAAVALVSAVLAYQWWRFGALAADEGLGAAPVADREPGRQME